MVAAGHRGSPRPAQSARIGPWTDFFLRPDTPKQRWGFGGSGLDFGPERTSSSTQEEPMSSKGLIYMAAVALAVTVAYDKYGKRG